MDDSHLVLRETNVLSAPGGEAVRQCKYPSISEVMPAKSGAPWCPTTRILHTHAAWSDQDRKGFASSVSASASMDRGRLFLSPLQALGEGE